MLRRLLGICKPYSASKMFVSRGIPTLAELLRKSIYRFAQRIECMYVRITSHMIYLLPFVVVVFNLFIICVLYNFLDPYGLLIEIKD